MKMNYSLLMIIMWDNPMVNVCGWSDLIVLGWICLWKVPTALSLSRLPTS